MTNTKEFLVLSIIHIISEKKKIANVVTFLNHYLQSMNIKYLTLAEVFYEDN